MSVTYFVCNAICLTIMPFIGCTALDQTAADQSETIGVQDIAITAQGRLERIQGVSIAAITLSATDIF